MRKRGLMLLLLAGCSSARVAEPPAPELMGGEMVYMADAARFTDCRSNRSYPMAMEAAFADIERAYVEAVSTAGGRLYVTFEGLVTARPRMEGSGSEPTVVVNEFINVWPQQHCEQARADASLTNTYWRIVRLDGQNVKAVNEQREPHLVLRSADRQTRYNATAGCNQLMGNYTVEGDRIAFSQGASTKMFCSGELDRMERQLGAVLARVHAWRVFGNTLQFTDAGGARIALFEAVYR